MGQDRAAVVANCFNTNLILACNEPGLQKRCAEVLGKQELDTVSRNQALANNETRDGAALNRSDTEKFLVMASQLGTKDPCTGYIKMPGQLPVAEVDYSSWLKKPWWGGRSRVELGDPVLTLPERDQRFLVQVRPESSDPFDQVRVELEAFKLAKAADQAAELMAGSPYAAPAATAAAPGPDEAPAGATPTLLLVRARGQEAAGGSAPVPSTPSSPPPEPAQATAVAGGRGSAVRSDAPTPLLRATIDEATGEILGKLDNKGLAMSQQMDMLKPGHTLGLDLGNER